VDFVNVEMIDEFAQCGVALELKMEVITLSDVHFMYNPDAKQLHDRSIVIDGTCPLLHDTDYIDWYIEGGVTIVTPSVGGPRPAQMTYDFIGHLLELIRTRDDLLLIERAEDVYDAKSQGKIGIVFHFQGTDPIGDNLNNVNLFHKLGVRVMQLTYNADNLVGSGAQVDEDKGLTDFGRQFIERCNDVGVIVDCSHTGVRTTLEAIKASKKPVICSHSNPKQVFKTQSDRNINDDQIKAIANSGGVVGVAGFPGFISSSSHPSMDQFLQHVDYLVNIGGIDHVALGIDYYPGQHPVADQEEAIKIFDECVAAGVWTGPDYPRPPHIYPEGIETPQTMPRLTEALLGRGYSEEDTQKILGLNLVRVYKDVWGG